MVQRNVLGRSIKFSASDRSAGLILAIFTFGQMHVWQDESAHFYSICITGFPEGQISLTLLRNCIQNSHGIPSIS